MMEGGKKMRAITKEINRNMNFECGRCWASFVFDGESNEYGDLFRVSHTYIAILSAPHQNLA